MLVLSRKLGDRIMIGDRIVVTVVKLGNGRVRLGIEAPREVAVFREEIDPRLPPLPSVQPTA
jgi:carbon storage regulator